MRTIRKKRKTVIGLGQVLIAIALWLTFAPQQLGGPLTYVILSGSSMEPAFHRGDLILARSQSSYQVGDAVVYRHPVVGPIFHRIIGQEDGLYMLKGDNNPWEDSYTPNQEEVIGKLWLKVPGLGKLVTALRSPQWLALFSLGAGTALAVTVTDSRVQPRRLAKVKPAKASKRPLREAPFRPQDLLATLALLTLGAIILLTVSFSRPAYVNVVESIPYQHNAAFTYYTQAPPDLYDNAVVQPGEPIFRRLSDSFSLNFSYALGSESPLQHISGTTEMLLVLHEPNGWKRTMQLEAPTAFEGNSVEVSTTINLSKIQAYMDLFEEQTGVEPTQYTISIQPVVSVNGLIGVEPFVDEFLPSLDFMINDLQVRLLGDNGSAVEALIQSRASVISTDTIQDNHISVFGKQFAVYPVRILSLVLFTLFGGATLVMMLRVRRLAGQPEAQRIQSFYGPTVIPVHGFKFEYLNSLAELDSIEDLLRLAEENSSSILYEHRGDVHHYFLTTERVLYHYQCHSQPEFR
jgi:signal peptidase I